MARHMRDNYIAHRLMRHGPWSRFVLKAAGRDERLRQLSGDLMFSDGHLRPSDYLRLCTAWSRRT